MYPTRYPNVVQRRPISRPVIHAEAEFEGDQLLMSCSLPAYDMSERCKALAGIVIRVSSSQLGFSNELLRGY